MNSFWAKILVMLVIASLLIDCRSACRLRYKIPQKWVEIPSGISQKKLSNSFKIFQNLLKNFLNLRKFLEQLIYIFIVQQKHNVVVARKDD